MKQQQQQQKLTQEALFVILITQYAPFSWKGLLTFLLYILRYIFYCEMTFTSRKRVSCKHGGISLVSWLLIIAKRFNNQVSAVDLCECECECGVCVCVCVCVCLNILTSRWIPLNSIWSFNTGIAPKKMTSQKRKGWARLRPTRLNNKKRKSNVRFASRDTSGRELRE